MRAEYDPVTAKQELGQMIQDLRTNAGRGSTREISLAITRLEEAQMWLAAATLLAAEGKPS